MHDTDAGAADMGVAPAQDMRAADMSAPVAQETPDAEATKSVSVQEQKTLSHDAFDALLRAHVDEAAGRVDYAGFQRDEVKLDAYLARLGAVKLDALPDQERFATLINAYNAFTIKLILSRYPKVRSIRELGPKRLGPWKPKRWLLGGEKVSLDDIEHVRLRPVFRDPRVHFAVNCASIGCPPLRAEAYTGAKLDAQLEVAARNTLQNPRYVQVRKGRLYLTKIMKWYGGDFTNPKFKGSVKRLPEYVARYATDAVKRRIEAKRGKMPVRFMKYDWSLNQKGR